MLCSEPAIEINILFTPLCVSYDFLLFSLKCNFIWPSQLSLPRDAYHFFFDSTQLPSNELNLAVTVLPHCVLGGTPPNIITYLCK